MSKSNFLTEKVTVEEQRSETEFETVDEPEQRATVELRKQAKVDSEAIEKVAGDELDHPHGMTLEAEEKWQAREAEKRRTRERAEGDPVPAREAGSRSAAEQGSRQRRRSFQQRAASVDPMAEPEREDPREELSREELAAVNEQADRIAQEVREGGCRAAVARQLAERVVDGASVLDASVGVLEAEKRRPGTIVPIAKLNDAPGRKVDVQGRVAQLWDSSHPAIQQVGLLEDETGRVKFTVWKRSEQPPVDMGQPVRFRGVSRSWHKGRVSVALTGDSRVIFPERE